jgi:hypothetical protein
MAISNASVYEAISIALEGTLICGKRVKNEPFLVLLI